MTASRAFAPGHCLPQFNEVAREFERNFSERGEIGASVAIRINDEIVVDLWGGVADQDTGSAWKADTIAVVFSATKGMAATCIHILADRGLLDFNAPIARYWPEFAANGKDHITVAMALSHQAGLPLWQEPLPQGAFLDFDFVAERLAQEAPVWEPGTAHGYHAVTIGVIEGELVKRITGRRIGAFLREEVAEPLGADIWIGLPESEEVRVASLILGGGNSESPFTKKLMENPDWHGWKMITNSGGDISPETVNGRARHAAEIPASGGIASARGLARLYAPLSLDGAVDGVRLVDSKALPAMRTTRSASDKDLLLQVPTTFTLGYSKSWGSRALGQGEHVIIGEHAFGAPGMGGSIGFADSEARMSFGYVMNRHGSGVGLNDRGQSLIDAAYRAIGYSSCEPGFWVR